MSATEKLFQAYQNNEPLQLKELGLDDVEEAYKVQDRVLDLKAQNGETLKGYKISLTSQETQELFDSDSPLYGGMTDKSVKNTLSLKNYNDPMLEMEVVFLVDKEVSPNDSVEDVMKKCRVAPGIEVPDGRYEDWFPNATLYEIVADGAVNGAVVVGEDQKVSYDDLDNTTATLYLDGETVKKGPSTDVMGHPAKAVQWLAQALDSRGKTLKPGQFVSSGTFVLPVELQVGTYKAKFENLGSVELEVRE